MALNISRIFRRGPQVAAGDVNGDGAPEAHDAGAQPGGEHSGIMQDYYAHSNATTTDRLPPGKLEYPNVVTDNNDPDGQYRSRINDQTPADWNERSAPGSQGFVQNSHTSAFDLSVVGTSDGGNGGESASHASDRMGNFDIQGITAKGPSRIEEDVTEIVLNAAAGHSGQGGNALDAGFSISDDLLNEARTAQGGLGPNNPGGLGVKWEGPDYDATQNSLISEVGFPKLDGSDKSFTSAEGRSMSFELLKGEGPGSGATERSAAPGHGLRDMEIDLGHGGTLNHADGPGANTGEHGLLSEIKFPADSYTATDDLWKFRDGPGGGSNARTAQPGSEPDVTPGHGAQLSEGAFALGTKVIDDRSHVDPQTGDSDDVAAPPSPVGDDAQPVHHFAPMASDRMGNFEIQDAISGRGGEHDFGPKEPAQADAVEYGLITARTSEPSGFQAVPELDAGAGLHRPDSGAYTATDDLWVRGAAPTSQGDQPELQVTGDDADTGARMMGPGHQGSGFMMQDGELYPRGILPFMEGQNFTGSDEQMGQLVSHLRNQGLIDTSTGEIVWVGGPVESNGISESGDMMNWLRGNGLIDTSTGEVSWVHQPGPGVSLAEGWAGVGAEANFDAGARTMGPGHQGSGFMMQDGELYPRGAVAGGESPDGGPGAGETSAQYNPKEIGIDKLAARFAEAQDGSGTDNANRMAHPGFHDLDGMPAGAEVLDAPGSGTFEQVRGALPEVDDEVLVGFSALDADADAPTTLVDLHSHAANADGLVGHVDIPHLDPGHHDLGGGHHGHGFMDYTDDAGFDN